METKHTLTILTQINNLAKKLRATLVSIFSIFIFNKNRKLIQKYVLLEFVENIELPMYCIELLAFSVKLSVFTAKLLALVTLLN